MYTENQIKGMSWDKSNAVNRIEKNWASETEQSHRQNIANIIIKNMQINDSILDAGCGTGQVYNYLKEAVKERNINYLGIDGSYDFVKLSRHKFPDGTFELQNLYAMTFPADSFDIVYCIDVLQHCDYYEQALKEIYRVAKRLVIIRTWVTAKEDEIKYDGTFYSNKYNNKKLLDFASSLCPNSKDRGNGIFFLFKK